MTTLARLGWNTTVWLGTNATTATLAELHDIRSIQPPENEANAHEVTHLTSPQKRREFIGGLVDGSTITLKLNYTPGSGTDARLLVARDAGNKRSVRFILPDETGTPAYQVDGFAFVKSYNADPVEPDAPVTATAVLKITGVETVGAPTGRTKRPSNELPETPPVAEEKAKAA